MGLGRWNFCVLFQSFDVLIHFTALPTICVCEWTDFPQNTRLHVFLFTVLLFEGSFLSEISYFSGTSEPLLMWTSEDVWSSFV